MPLDGSYRCTKCGKVSEILGFKTLHEAMKSVKSKLEGALDPTKRLHSKTKGTVIKKLFIVLGVQSRYLRLPTNGRKAHLTCHRVLKLVHTTLLVELCFKKLDPHRL